MIAIVLCILAFAASFWAGKRSLGVGLAVLLLFGYFYGILRANLITSFSHFIFDCGLLGLYLSQSWTSRDPEEAKQIKSLRTWVAVLIGWCFLVAIMPFQPWMVSLVGLRGNVFFLPVLLLGCRLKEKDLMQMAAGLAALNILALGFGILEYFMGIRGFYPVSPVTEIIYNSGDVEGGFYRIPAIFSSAHAYGGTMVATLPYLVGAWNRSGKKYIQFLLFAGTSAALLGVLLSATRLNVIFASVILLVAIFVRHNSLKSKFILLLLIAAIGWTAWTNARFQRFKSLGDTEAVSERLAGSVNRGFFEILTEYPMGNGLGGGGTSLPYFLATEVKNPIGMENEYARILCEQGIIGLLLWIGFILWFASRAPVALQASTWAISRRIIWCLIAFTFATMWAGVGFLTAIPQTLIVMLGIGWTTTRPEQMRVPSLLLRPILAKRQPLTSAQGIR